MKALLIVLALVSATAIAKEKAEVRYVGMGRYTCSGDRYKCAQIDANNRLLDTQRETKENARIEKEREQHRRDFELYSNPRQR